jgi:hypothetical protein
MKKKITRVVRKSGELYLAYIKEIPGVNTKAVRSPKLGRT